MKRLVKELMTGFSEIPVVDEDSTLFEAVLEIGVTRSNFSGSMRCPVALVVDKEKNVAGFLEFRLILKALEPGYEEFVEAAMEGGFSTDQIRLELQKHGLWEDALEGLCKKAGETVIKSLMTIPEDGQTTSANSSINEAVYQMLVSGREYLYVMDGKNLAGLINLSDIMGYVCDTVRACRI